MALPETPIAEPDPMRSAIAPLLLGWYDRHHRHLPWRTAPAQLASGVRPDPYHVWLSEIMLQQTTVATVKPYFAKFLDRWPTVLALAAADPDDIMKGWAGLGYYSRARNLKACADVIAADYGGQFPDTEVGLRSLPGIGAYTAAAISAIAFDRTAVVVDGNVERVVTRLAAIATPLPAAKGAIRDYLGSIFPANRPGDFAQAMMDLGATICTPRKPACLTCPLNDNCAALAAGDPEHYPQKLARPDKPQRYGAAFVAMRDDGALLLRKRAGSGLLAGMSEVPTTGWTARVDGERTVEGAPFAANWEKCGQIAHIFTHFRLELHVFRAKVGAYRAVSGEWWVMPDTLSDEALPTVMKKVIEAAIPGATQAPRLKGRP
ncbi:A/G-specific adenine glycosylase [Mesorhizobium sp. NBSH29]|uniref:A/G-specific adenine glycosylase n=1 Tax=Mesorhizobium sp. NBSH29 TaxID=2654249 RepID=UPI00189677DC|nr:A/G-specific adenine glycosylase [Mesorhizobium sp. NBSH29]QPC87040.1 A/G-specific adenine glycosylase [Mesorhizobium sp. NBSH29]